MDSQTHQLPLHMMGWNSCKDLPLKQSSSILYSRWIGFNLFALDSLCRFASGNEVQIQTLHSNWFHIPSECKDDVQMGINVLSRFVILSVSWLIHSAPLGGSPEDGIWCVWVWMSVECFFLRYPAALDDMGSSQHGLDVFWDDCRWGSDSHNGISSISVTWMDWECLSLPSLSIVENRWLSLDVWWCSVGWVIDVWSRCGLVLGLMIGCQGEFLCQSYG